MADVDDVTVSNSKRLASQYLYKLRHDFSKYQVNTQFTSPPQTTCEWHPFFKISGNSARKTAIQNPSTSSPPTPQLKRTLLRSNATALREEQVVLATFSV
eukprot:6175392-Pleurochrysis_carterae.AAC.1